MDYANQMDKDEAAKLKAEKFNPTKTLDILKQLNADTKDIDNELFCSSLLEFVKILNEMSSALGIAFKDVTSKVSVLRQNRNRWSDVSGGIFKLIQNELDLKLEKLNSENNKKQTKDPQYATYESTARTVLRMTWFLDFLSVMLGGLGKDPKRSTSDACKEAYEKCLGPHHPFLLRQAAKIAMLAAPGRSSFETKLFPGVTSEQICTDLLSIEEELIKIRGVLWDFYNANNLTELP